MTISHTSPVQEIFINTFGETAVKLKNGQYFFFSVGHPVRRPYEQTPKSVINKFNKKLERKT